MNQVPEMRTGPGDGRDPYRWTTGNTRHREGCPHYYPENARPVTDDEFETMPICSTCAGSAAEGTLVVPPDPGEVGRLFEAADVTSMRGFTAEVPNGPRRTRWSRAALLDGVMPPRSGVHYAWRVADALLGLDVDMAEATRQVLEANRATLRTAKDAYDAEVRERRAQEAEHAVEVEEAGEQVTEEAEAAGVPGVYCYSYPDTLRCPDSEGRVKLKIGGTGKDGIGRVLEQVSKTAQPQDAIVLRVFRAEQGSWEKVERWFQQALTETGCPRPGGRRVGDEWWWTSLRHLDWLAAQAVALGLVAEVTTKYDPPELDA